MRLALIGVGKTGHEVYKMAQAMSDVEIVGPFDKEDTPYDYKGQLEKADVVLVFTPGQALDDLLPVLETLSTPVIIGSTGYEWKEETLTRLKREKRHWVMASNFSLGMMVVKALIQTSSELSKKLLPEATFSMQETHHIHKKDAPSGTALTWKRWFLEKRREELEIESIRLGDEVGEHRFFISTPFEEIEIRHRSKTRALFAQGALWASKQLIISPPKEYGLTLFEDWVTSLLQQ